MSEKIKNYVLVASTGSGKSRTGNTITGGNHFKVGEGFAAETSQLSEATNTNLGIKVIDTGGFGDHRVSEEEINTLLKNVTSKIVKDQGNSTNKIDAFLLVVKLDPRPTCLKEDIDRLVNIFGKQCLKSVILLPIDHSEKLKLSDEEFHSQLAQWSEIIKILEQAKGSPFSPDWYVRWDNVNPRPNQLSELQSKADKLPAYTHEMFIEAEKQIKERHEKIVKERLQKEQAELREKARIEKQQLEEKIKKQKEEIQRQRKQMERKKEQERVRREQEQRRIRQEAERQRIANERYYQEQMRLAQQERNRQAKILRERQEEQRRQQEARLQAQRVEQARQLAEQQAHLNWLQQQQQQAPRKKRKWWKIF